LVTTSPAGHVEANIHETFAKTFMVMQDDDRQLRCPNLTTIISATYEDGITLTRSGWRRAQAQAQYLVRHVYRAHMLASIARQLVQLIKAEKTIIIGGTSEASVIQHLFDAFFGPGTLAAPKHSKANTASSGNT
jgi:hypothetical protein